MILYEFRNKYFADWRVAGITYYGTERGCLKLRDKNSFIKIFYKLNGAKHYLDSCVTVEYVEGDE